jgi:hypothetical protein
MLFEQKGGTPQDLLAVSSYVTWISEVKSNAVYSLHMFIL